MPGAAQADATLEAIAAAGGVDLVALDVEPDGSAPGIGWHDARVWTATVTAAGQAPGLYASVSGYPGSLGQAWRWIANRTGRPPAIPWDLWQYQGNPLDRDRFDGTADELVALGSPISGGGNLPPGGSDMRFIGANGFSVVSGMLVNVGAGATWTYLDGSPGGSIAQKTALVCVGKGDGDNDQHVVQITTRAPYPDGVARPTLVLVTSTNDPYPAPVLPPPAVDCDDVVTLELDKAATRAHDAVLARP
jgi:hypothetical protein